MQGDIEIYCTLLHVPSNPTKGSLLNFLMPSHNKRTDMEQIISQLYYVHTLCVRGILRYFHTYVCSDQFLGFKILSFSILGGFQKKKYFWGIK